jgi:hypothetical protein
VHSLISFVHYRVCIVFSWSGAKFLANLGSVIFGVLGTWLMARRYANRFFVSLLAAFLFPMFFLLRRAGHARDVMNRITKTNLDVPDSGGDMTIGVYLLFWAFVLQLVALLIDTFS